MKKIIIGIVIALMVGGGIYWYLTNQFHYLPDWYRTSSSSEPHGTVENIPAEIDERQTPEPQTPPPQPESPSQRNKPIAKSPKKTPQPPQSPEEVVQQLHKNQQVQLTETEVTELILATVHEHLTEEQAAFVKGLRTDIHPDKVDVEMVVNVKKIPWELLPSQYRFVKEYITRTSPNNLYLKLSGTPLITNQYLTLAEDATVTIGKVKYSLNTLQSFFGLKGLLPPKIALNRVGFSSLELQEDRLILKKE
ncbi:MAG: hypothetical protein D6748_10780 [Calditrichaeota bacterium]|nr:MAG: hypothetical protein D6748_10780 [Calditrichota bacterium]